MSREYAVIDDDRSILFQSAGFSLSGIRDTVPLSGGLFLVISGSDDAPKEGTSRAGAPGTDDAAAEIAALRAQLKEAQDANAAKETFLSSMSHDIRTPMNAILGMTTLAKKHIDEKTRVLDALNKIETAGGHLLSLINDVLDMSRINSGRMKLTSDRFSLADLMHDTLSIIRPQVQQKGHSFTLEADAIDIEQFYGDALRLRQIYVNILSNAVKYTPDGGQIRVALSEEPDGDRCALIFSCRDNGIGMSDEFLRRIFEPFERVNSTTISKIEGTGLGMSIVKKLTDAMGGTVTVQSRVGEGTKVTVRIPMAYASVRADGSALAGQRLLILETDPKARDAFSRYLDEYHVPYTVTAAVPEALDALTDADFRSRPYTGLILGALPDGAGLFDTAQYFHHSFPALTIVLVSDADWGEIEYRANRSGISGFIPRPIFRKSLINGLGRALQGSGPDPSASAVPQLAGRHILLVEDNLINREIAKEILSATEAQIDTAEDGRQAVDAFLASPEGHYDLILMDVQMPVLDGYGATGEIRASGRADARVPIYAMTANTFAEDIARARASGMDGHIAKPIDMHTLMQVLRQI